jgi:tripartite-type tricarboxylate transporter receptor subunit TctC
MKSRLFAVALAGLAWLAGASAAADTWPAKPITLIVTYPAGGGADLMARLIAPKLAESLGQPVLVDNRPGASGQIAAAAVAKAAPDGYTLMLDASSYAVNPSLFAKLPYDPGTAFVPVSVLALFPNMLVVNAQFGAKDVKDLIAMAKAKPGSIAYASSGNGSAQHLAGALFEQRADVEMLHIPYKGGGPALVDVMGGQVPVFFANVASGLQHVKSDKLRALAITGKRRVDALAGVPTMAEAGVPGYEVYEWNAVFAPAGTPAHIVLKLSDAIAKALKAPDVVERIAAAGGEIQNSNPRAAGDFIREQTRFWGKVVKDRNIKPE